MAKKKKSKRSTRPKGQISDPQSPVGLMKTSKGKLVNGGLNDPKMPLYREPPFIGWFK